MDTEQAAVEIADAIVHLERLADECHNNKQYALYYSLCEVQQMLLRADRELKPVKLGDTDNS